MDADISALPAGAGIKPAAQLPDQPFPSWRRGLIQTSFVVEDLEATVDWWTRGLGIGPFFLNPCYPGTGRAIYRGEPSQAQLKIALSFVGNMSIELLQPLDGHPSVYRKTIEKRGYGFHHFGIATDDIEASILSYEQKGYTLCYTADIPMGGYVAYMDGPPSQLGFVELIPGSDATDAFFGALWRQTQNWDGSAPLRLLGEATRPPAHSTNTDRSKK